MVAVKAPTPKITWLFGIIVISIYLISFQLTDTFSKVPEVEYEKPIDFREYNFTQTCFNPHKREKFLPGISNLFSLQLKLFNTHVS